MKNIYDIYILYYTYEYMHERHLCIYICVYIYTSLYILSVAILAQAPFLLKRRKKQDHATLHMSWCPGVCSTVSTASMSLCPGVCSTVSTASMSRCPGVCSTGQRGAKGCASHCLHARHRVRVTGGIELPAIKATLQRHDPDVQRGRHH